MKEEIITILIVDDDTASQQVLESHLRTMAGVEILGVASGAAEAYSMILEKSPDVIFLDVEMPEKNGFDLVRDLHKLDIRPCIIFQTAFNKYAIEAIKNAAFDYLLKPVGRDDLLAAMTRYRSNRRNMQLDEKVDRLFSHLDQHRKIRFNTRQGFIMIDPLEIVYCQADWNYTEIWLSKEKKVVVTMNISRVEELLPQDTFVKISRSLLINRLLIEKLNRKTRILLLRKGETPYELKVAANHLGDLD